MSVTALYGEDRGMTFSRATSSLLNDVMAQADAEIFFSFATSGRGGGGSMAPSRLLITVVFSLIFTFDWLFLEHVEAAMSNVQ